MLEKATTNTAVCQGKKCVDIFHGEADFLLSPDARVLGFSRVNADALTPANESKIAGFNGVPTAPHLLLWEKANGTGWGRGRVGQSGAEWGGVPRVGHGRVGLCGLSIRAWLDWGRGRRSRAEWGGTDRAPGTEWDMVGLWKQSGRAGGVWRGGTSWGRAEWGGAPGAVMCCDTAAQTRCTPGLGWG